MQAPVLTNKQVAQLASYNVDKQIQQVEAGISQLENQLEKLASRLDNLQEKKHNILQLINNIKTSELSDEALQTEMLDLLG